MENSKSNILLVQKGQSTVEYIMLLIAISSFSMIVFKSTAFKDLIGPGLFQDMARRMEYSARYGQNGNTDGYGNSYTKYDHPLYINEKTKESNFFSPTDSY